MSAMPTTPDVLTRILNHMDSTPVLPHVVFRVLEVSNSSDAGLHEMERAIAIDPGFTAKVLSMVNSAAFALPKKVASIRDALMFLGIKQVRNLAMTIGVFDLFVGKSDQESLRRRGWWRLSLDTAVCARLIARETGLATPDDVYTCGLLHLIGKTFLDRFGGSVYEAVLILQKQGMSDISAERRVYGCDHVEVGVAAATKWAMPLVITEGMGYCQPSMDSSPARAATALGHYMATCLQEGHERNTDHVGAPRWALEALGYDVLALDELSDRCSSAIAQSRLEM